MSGSYYRALATMHRRVRGNIDQLARSAQPDWVRISELKRLQQSLEIQMRKALEDDRDAPPRGAFASDAAAHNRASTFNSDA